MPSYDRPYFPPSRRGHRWREEEDDRGPWISRDRDEFERDRERDFRGRDRRFEDFEEWERPVQMR